MPADTPGRRAESTLKENEREIATLKKAFGHFRADQLEKGDAYEYLDARTAFPAPGPRRATRRSR